ncbi:MAG: CtsR family transcriptional regulator [Clostridia bacterium]|nr:CtsR family transcriptional regulator [Clostridia bacterium]
MANVSDIIENFILSTMGNSTDINLSRNELADFFNCAPSQINYVLTTRFNLNRGYIIQSQRGGGGFIKIVKLKDFDNHYVYKIIEENLNKPISYKDALYILEDLVSKSFINKTQAQAISYVVDDKALSNPIKIEGQLRANILKSFLINVLRGNNNE